MNCVNCGGVLSASGCTLCGAGRITPASDKVRWSTMAYEALEAKMSRLSEQRDRMLALLTSVRSMHKTEELIGSPFTYCRCDVCDYVRAECEAEDKPCQP